MSSGFNFFVPLYSPSLPQPNNKSCFLRPEPLSYLWFTVWSHCPFQAFALISFYKKRVMFHQNKHPDFTHMEGNYTCFVHDRSINSLNNCFDLRSRSLSILSHFTKTCGSRNHDILGDIFNFGQCLKKHCYIWCISSLIKQLSLID